MKRNMRYVLILAVISLSEMCFCNEIPEENELHESTHQSDKKSRFISFNNDHGEVKIELDFAVPFMNIPVSPKKFGSHGLVEPLLEVNTKGLVTVGTILLILITIVPKVVKLFIPQAHATVTDGLMPLMSRIDDALHTFNIPSTECYQRSACWVASSSVINPVYMKNFSPDWLADALKKPEIQEAFQRGQNGEDCSAYKCSAPVQTITKLMNIGKTMLSSKQ